MARSADLEPVRLPPPRATFGSGYSYPRPSDLLGYPPPRYPDAFYESLGRDTRPVPLRSPEEERLIEQQQRMNPRLEVNLQGGGGSNTLAGGGGETLTMGPNEEAVAIQYANQGAIRNRQLNDRLSPILATAATAAGVDDIRVISGGQAAFGPNRTGSHRHDLGRAGDIQLLINGRVLDFNDPNDRPIFEKFITTAVAAGAKGVGAGSDYMGTKTIHVGFGSAGAWGAKGKSRNAPEWLTAAFDAGRTSPDVAVDPAAVAAFEASAPQFTDSALTGLTAPMGETQTPSVPAGTEAYAPFFPGAGPGGQVAIADLLGLPPPPVAQSVAPTVPETAAPEIARRPGPGGALGVDLGQQPAGMPPPPSRPGNFDWLGGGAPEAAMVPPPGISPLRPALGGPGDRRPQPPIPSSRPPGGPPPYPAASMANMPATVGMPPSAPPGGVGAFSAPAGPSDLVPFLPPPAATAAPAIAPPLERANRIASGQGGPVIPISPAEMAASLANANANTEMSLGLGGLGTPETQMSLDRTFPPPAAAPSPWSDRSRAFDIPPPMTRMAEFGPSPRPNITPDFDFAAGPGPTFTPPSLTPDIRGRPEYPGSMPAAPPPLGTAADDPYRAPSSFDASRPISGGGGSDVLAAGNASPLSLPPSPFRYDPLSSARLNLPPAVPEVPIPPSPDQYEGGRFLPPDADPNNITLPTEATAPIDLRPPTPEATIDPAAVLNVPRQPIVAAAAAAAATPAKTPREEKKRNSFLSRLLPGGGSIFGIGPNGFFSNAGSFTPFAGAGGSSPFNMQPNGAMGTTNWRQGSVTGNPAMSGVMWNRSGNNGSVGYVTSPFTGDVPIYSGSPNRF